MSSPSLLRKVGINISEPLDARRVEYWEHIGVGFFILLG